MSELESGNAGSLLGAEASDVEQKSEHAKNMERERRFQAATEPFHVDAYEVLKTVWRLKKTLYVLLPIFLLLICVVTIGVTAENPAVVLGYPIQTIGFVILGVGIFVGWLLLFIFRDTGNIVLMLIILIVGMFGCIAGLLGSFYLQYFVQIAMIRPAFDTVSSSL